MADVFSKEKRSSVMRAIKGSNTLPEVRVRSIVEKMGFRPSRLKTKLPGRPDIVLKKIRTAIFVHGCFWHFHKECKIARLPKSNKGYWLAKFRSNTARDRRNLSDLKKMGWKVIVIWECQTRKEDRIMLLKKRLARVLSE
jgi:DNA mismatch endonuclease (patch repair protein)